MARIDAVEFARSLIRCPSITPADAGALDCLENALKSVGFRTYRLAFEDAGTARIDNLYARIGERSPNFCFAGHTDVVPTGRREDWSCDPFAAEIREGRLYGRGAADMKGAIAAFVAAASRYLDGNGGSFDGSISLLITGDEEADAINGTVKMLDWLRNEGEVLDHCLVGEPTNPDTLGDMIKIGRRGSMNSVLNVHGSQGHVAYPDLARNPVPILIAMLERLLRDPLDQGNAHFQPSNLEVTSIDVGNLTSNVIPGEATARFNIRFNTEQTAARLESWIRTELDQVSRDYDLDVKVSGDAFLTKPGGFIDILSKAVRAVAGKEPALSTSGGTSDARFIKNVCEVAEFGLPSQTMHKVDEYALVKDIEALSEIYEGILKSYFTA